MSDVLVRMKRDAEYLAEDDDEKAPPPKQRKTEDTSQQSEGYSKFSRKMMVMARPHAVSGVYYTYHNKESGPGQY